MDRVKGRAVAELGALKPGQLRGTARPEEQAAELDKRTAEPTARMTDLSMTYKI